MHCRSFHKHSLVQVKRCLSFFGGHRVVRNHQDCLVIFGAEAVKELKYFISTLAVEVAGRLVAEQVRRICNNRSSYGDALFLSA